MFRMSRDCVSHNPMCVVFNIDTLHDIKVKFCFWTSTSHFRIFFFENWKVKFSNNISFLSFTLLTCISFVYTDIISCIKVIQFRTSNHTSIFSWKIHIALQGCGDVSQRCLFNKTTLSWYPDTKPLNKYSVICLKKYDEQSILHVPL